MGIFWDLYQQSQLEEQRGKSESLEDRVELLEEELTKTRELLYKTLHVLEEHVNIDIDGDGEKG